MGAVSEQAAMLFGHRTWLDLVGQRLSSTEPDPFEELLTRIPEYVASRDATGGVPHPPSHPLSGEVAETVTALKEQLDGQLVVLGSLQLAHAPTVADLVDRYVITTISVLLGRDTRLFDGVGAGRGPACPASLAVERAQSFDSGVRVRDYRVVR